MYDQKTSNFKGHWHGFSVFPFSFWLSILQYDDRKEILTVEFWEK